MDEWTYCHMLIKIPVSLCVVVSTLMWKGSPKPPTTSCKRSSDLIPWLVLSTIPQLSNVPGSFLWWSMQLCWIPYKRTHCSQQIYILGRVLFIVSQLAFHLQFDFSTLQLADLALYPTPSMVCAATNAQGPLPTSQLFCPCTEIVALCNGLTGFSVCLELVSDERTTYETIWDLAWHLHLFASWCHSLLVFKVPPT